MEHEIEDWMRDTEQMQHTFSADAVPFVPVQELDVSAPILPPVQKLAPNQVIVHSDLLVEQLQALSDKISLCVMRLDGLSVQKPDVSAPEPVVEAVLEESKLIVILPNGPVAAQSVDLGTGTRNPVLVLDDFGTGTCNPVPTPLELREARHEVYVEELLKKQGVSDERRQQLRQERQHPAPPTAPPEPEPERTLEDVQRQISEYRQRHLAMDKQMEQKPRRTKSEKKMDKEAEARAQFMAQAAANRNV